MTFPLQAGGTSNANGAAISFLSDGSSIVTGDFGGTATFGNTTLTSAGGDDVFIAKLDANGNYVWVKQAGGTSGDGANGISSLSDGSSIVTGYFNGTATFGSTTLTSAGLNDVFIAKLDANGEFVWAKQAGGTSGDYATAISSLSDGSSIVTGNFLGTASFGSTTLTSAGMDQWEYHGDGFIAKLDANGNYVWAKQVVGTSGDNAVGVSSLSNGSSIVTGYFQGTATFGSTTLSSAGNDDDDVFIAALDSNGNWISAIDTTRPTIVISSDVSSLKAGETATPTFMLSESSSDFVASDVTVTGGTLSSFSGSGTTYTATFTPTADSTTNGVISVASSKFSDAAGNTNNDGSDSNNTVTLTVDTVRPTIAISSDATSLKAGETATIRYLLSESSSNFVQSDVTVSGGALSNWNAASSTSYSSTFTASSNSAADGVISVANSKFSDAAGNFNNDGSDANNTVTIANLNDAPTGSVTISGTAKQGETLTAANSLADVDGLGTIAYGWKRAGTAISGATSANYTLVQADVGSAISVTASYTDGAGTAESKTSNATSAVANVNDLPTGSVTISGTPTQG
ncbi:Ig-like domain-containing protein, partial [Synechococcus sp. BIOS-E4-1]|uniref:Ig-like domain-containing protein n=1 Tax=Synechococcus sp. BIOS-E4-1 TaxID=1400864 RepID=UPI001CA45211